MPNDISLTGDFQSTTVTVEPKTDAGRALFVDAFGPGVVSVEIPKSRAGDFIAHVKAKGLSI